MFRLGLVFIISLSNLKLIALKELIEHTLFL